MTRLTKSIVGSFVLFAMSVSASQTKADSYRHIQELALDIQLKCNELVAKTHHYVHTPNYHRMLRCVANMRTRAVRIHSLSLQRGCLYTMSDELRVLDNQYHDIEAIFDQTEIDAAHGHGHIRGATRHVKRLLRCIEDDIHHIRVDIADMQAARAVRRPYSRSYQTPSYRPPVYQPPVYRPPSYRTPGCSRTSGSYRSHPRSRVEHTGYRYGGRDGIHVGGGGVQVGGDRFSVRIGW